MAGAHRAPGGVSLREYFETRLADKDIRDQQRFDAQQKALDAALLAAEKAVQTALIAAEKAVSKAEAASEKRFEASNEFRGQLSDQAATFFPRAEAEQRLSAMAEQIRILTARVDTSQGRTGGASALYGYLIAAAGLILAVVAFVTR
jgi:hypothetical protein